MKINEVVIAPVLTEKATNLSRNQVYMFYVNLKSTKYQVKETLEKIYPVKISAIRTIVRKGKEHRVGRKMLTKKMTDKKIAFVKLKSGKFDLFPQT